MSKCSINISDIFADECSLCYHNEASVHGFMLDRNNCQKFYMCIPNGNGYFTVEHMTCPDCMFWDDEQLSCVQVDNSCHSSHIEYTGVMNNKS